MTTQIQIIGDELRTFSDVKGAKKAAKRDVAKLPESVYILDIEYKTGHDGRIGVLVLLDHLPTEFADLDLSALVGFGVRCDRVEEEEEAPAKADKPAKPAKADKTPAPARKRASGEINVAPKSKAYPMRWGSIQQQMAEMLSSGCTFGDLQRVCVRRDGRTWDDNSIRSACYYDLANKGYGVRTEWKSGVEAWKMCSWDDADNEWMSYLAKSKIAAKVGSQHPDDFDADEIVAMLNEAMEAGYDPKADQLAVYFLVYPEGQTELLPAKKSAAQLKADKSED